VHLVEVGEAVGRLAPVLRRMADYLERTEELHRSVRLALIYPGLIVAVAAGAIGFMLTVIVPTFAEMFEGFGAELPAATRRVIAASELLADHALGTMGAVIAGAALIRYALRSDAGRRFWDRWTLRLPFIGRMLQKGLGARFCRTLGTLIEHDVPLTRALRLLSQAVANVIARDELVRMTHAVERGESLSHPLAHSEVFPPLVSQMILVGEKTARLDETLLHVADVYEDELDHHVDALTSVIEPVLILVLGIILGAILIALYLPLLDLVTVMP
jgi:type IV pilus assembly protein PilC